MTVVSRSEFAASQEEMGRNWYENLLKSGVDLETYLAGRRAAYNDRWREAGRFIRPGARILDIGGGNLYPELLGYIKSKAWDYWFFDIGEPEVANSRKLAMSMGFKGEQFRQGFNHELDFEPDYFDAVFSSHCIEHSMELTETLAQINRILKPGGNLLMAVPFGWELNPAHPYFFLENEWIALVEDAGFQIRAYQIACEYPEHGYDLFIAARKVAAPAQKQRIDPADFRKTNFAFHDFRSPTVRYFGSNIDREDHLLMDGSDWRVEISLDQEWRELLPIFTRHNWSGVARCEAQGQAVYEDLYRMSPIPQPMRLTLSAPASGGKAEIAPVGKSAVSLGRQGVFVGYMVR